MEGGLTGTAMAAQGPGTPRAPRLRGNGQVNGVLQTGNAITGVRRCDGVMATTNRGAARLHRLFEASCDRVPSATALECGEHVLTYAELDARANRLAHLLHGLGIGRGSRVAILLPRSVDMYAALLAVGKAGAAFVPVDPAAPPDRVAFITADARVDAVLTVSELSAGVSDRVKPGLGERTRLVELDRCAAALASVPATRPDAPDIRGAASGARRETAGLRSDDPTARTADDDPLAYIMYTSGSTGRPKGVAIAHSSICNFLDVVPDIYDVRPEDRVHQGMVIAFDFSIEEIWPTWTVGATLVAGPGGSGTGLFGAELADALEESGITVLYCVPTLLATIPRDLPGIRTVLVGGEACPAQLVERWSRPGRRILNTYGPTETTVTATVTELRPGRPVTIGKPLPTYTVVLLDDHRRSSPAGAVGEICVGGPGVARGYVGRPELTAERFIEHPLAPRGSRLYRTGDLGRLTADGEIEYLGRADDEVKVRGYRVDLGEIDNVLLEDPGVAEAATALVAIPERNGAENRRELSAYVVPAPHGTARRTGTGRAGTGNEDDLIARLHQHLRHRLPAYMVPHFLDILPRLPALPSGKVDRKRLPAPTGRRLVSQGHVVAPRGELETRVRDVWAEVFGIGPDTLSTEADFFADLGGHSLLAAQAVSVLRGRGIGADVGPTLRDLYANPTVGRLAAHLDTPDATSKTRGEGPASAADGSPSAPLARPRPLRHGSGRIAAAGLVQAGVIYLLLSLTVLPLADVLGRQAGQATGQMPVPVQPLIAALVSYFGIRWLLPAVLARPLSAGIRPGRYPLWGATYLRLWALALLLRVSPLPALSGSPLVGCYLRLLGARIGPRTTIATGAIPLPSLLQVGADASVGYGTMLHAWRVADGWVTVAPISIGSRAYVGAHTVLEPGARMEAGSGLGEQSVLGEGEVVPAGARWAGSPPVPLKALDPRIEDMLRAGGTAERRRPRYVAAAQLGVALLETLRLAVVLPSAALIWFTWLDWGTPPAVLAALVLAGPLYVVRLRRDRPRQAAGAAPLAGRRSSGPLGPGCPQVVLRQAAGSQPRRHQLPLCHPLHRPLATAAGRAHRPRCRGVHRLPSRPGPARARRGQFVADMAGVGGAAFAGGRVDCRPTEIGRHAFVGNAAYLPAGTRTGPDSLIGVGTVPPQDGVPAGTAWLGSPAIHLPRRQSSGNFPEELTFRPTPKAVRRRLAIEFLRVTMPASLLGVTAFLFLLALAGVAHAGPALCVLLAPLLVMAAGLTVIAYCALLKRLVIGTYEPHVAPLWSWFVRRTEFVTGLYEAAAVPAGLATLTGTPFLPPALRLFGARIGRPRGSAPPFSRVRPVEVGDEARSARREPADAPVRGPGHEDVEGHRRGGRHRRQPHGRAYDGVVGEGVWLDALSWS